MYVLLRIILFTVLTLCIFAIFVNFEWSGILYVLYRTDCLFRNEWVFSEISLLRSAKVSITGTKYDMEFLTTGSCTFKVGLHNNQASVRAIEASVADLVDVEDVLELVMDFDRLYVPAITV